MNRRELIKNLRTSGKLKASKPAVVFLKANYGKIYNGGYSNFIMTIKNSDVLYFQKLSLFNTLKPKGDFSIELKDFVSYCLKEDTMANVLFLYNKDKNFIGICYHKGIPDTYQTEENINRMIKIFDEKGLKKINILTEEEEENE